MPCVGLAAQRHMGVALPPQSAQGLGREGQSQAAKPGLEGCVRVQAGGECWESCHAVMMGEPARCLVSAFQCLQQNPPATQSNPTSACPAALLWLHVPAGCRWIGWEQASNRLSFWEPGILCPALGQLTGKANLGYLSVCCRLSCSITLILWIPCLFGLCCPAPWNPAQCG